ncbi:MAG: muconolactone Delta-isomerase family protein [Gaiellales bacterium]|jgi:muconolactone D-isomerase
MEFLVRMTIRLPPDTPDQRRAELIAREAVRGRELIEQGALIRIWRLPGRWANISLYQAADATELHQLISSLPMWPWMDVSVEALATHPLEA